MFEDFSRHSRFLKWLESVASGNSTSYPEHQSLTEDAAAFLARWDRARKENRGLQERYSILVSGVADLAGLSSQESSPKSPPEEILESLAGKLESKPAPAPDPNPELKRELDTTRAELRQAQGELEHARREVSAMRAELERERHRMESVTRYAYNLRRLMQKIHATGKVTPEIRGYIERLLEAGGVSVNGKRLQAPHTTTPQSKTTQQPPV